MYLVGRFDRFHSEIFEEDPLHDVQVIVEIDKYHLSEAVKDDNYQVINLENLTFYNPKSNAWEMIKRG
jgi:hypothetical protein